MFSPFLLRLPKIPPAPTFEEWCETERREKALRELRADIAKRYEAVEGG